MDPDVFDKALEKLWIHGGAMLDFAENVSRGQADDWRESYIAHGERKQEQISRMIRYAESADCRMSSLVRHFGDIADGQKPCAICDFCAPAVCVAQQFRAPNKAEREALLKVVAALRRDAIKSTGKLHSELYPTGAMTRDSFEELLGAMARAGLARLSDAVFEKDGKQIPYRKVCLTRAGNTVDAEAPPEFLIKSATAEAGKRKRKKQIPKRAAKGKSPAPAPNSNLEETLRTWRLAEAKRQGVPAFRIFSDRALTAIAIQRPASAAELLAIPGIGIGAVEKYGARLYRILHENR
jgi:superfamily II DNA helicase RecQ